MTVGGLLSCFRAADAHLVRQLTAVATLSPDARWVECGREQVSRLATALERHGARHDAGRGGVP